MAALHGLASQKKGHAQKSTATNTRAKNTKELQFCHTMHKGYRAQYSLTVQLYGQCMRLIKWHRAEIDAIEDKQTELVSELDALLSLQEAADKRIGELQGGAE